MDDYETKNVLKERYKLTMYIYRNGQKECDRDRNLQNTLERFWKLKNGIFFN